MAPPLAIRRRVPSKTTLLVAVFALVATVGPPVALFAVGAIPTHAAMDRATPSAAVATDWPTYDQNALRTGVDPSGASLSPATLAWTSASLDGELYGQPLVEAGRVFVATENNTVYALAADGGGVLWSTHVATPVASAVLPCSDISPTVGITSTPVIDPARGEIFVVATVAAHGGDAHRLLGLDLFSGAVLMNEAIDPAGSDPPAQLQRASLALASGRVIVGFGGNYGDCSHYHGWVVSAPEDGTAPADFEVSALSGDRQGAVWMGGAAPSVDANGNVWLATGNGGFTSSGDPYDHSDGVLELSPTMQLLQYFAPSAWYADNSADRDLGSSSPTLLSDGLVFQIGKSRTAYVLQQSSLGGVGGQVARTPGFCLVEGAAANINGTVYVPCKDSGIKAVTVARSAPVADWTSSSGAHGSTIVAGGMIWSIGGRVLYALDPASGAPVQQFSLGPESSSFPALSAADGLVLATASDKVHALDGPAGLPGPPISPQPHPGALIGGPAVGTGRSRRSGGHPCARPCDARRDLRGVVVEALQDRCRSRH